MISDCVSRWLKRLLYWQGSAVAHRPLVFLLGPLILTTVLSYGFVFQKRLTENLNSLDLYIPGDGLYHSAQKRIEAVFNETYHSSLDALNGVTFAVMLTRVDRGIILQQEFVQEYLALRKSLEGIVIKENDQFYSYQAICEKQRMLWNGCFPDLLSLLAERGIDGYRDAQLLTYPIARIRLPTSNYQSIIDLTYTLGGVKTTHQGFIISARAAVMNFHFPASPSPLLKRVTKKWERAFIEHVKHWKLERIPSSIEVSWFTLGAFEEEFKNVGKELIPLLPFLVSVMLIFCISACCVTDWVYSKPYIAIAGVMCALAAIISGFGLVMMLQIKLVSIVYVAPFLVMSIGVDDMFLMLAAWRRTSVTSSVHERLANTFSDAAVSITITSLTDILSFSVGAFSAFPAVRFFCIYTAVAILFAYIYQITFFGACMAYSGIREASNRHCITFKKIMAPDEALGENRGICYRIFCTGGDKVVENNSSNSSESSSNSVKYDRCPGPQKYGGTLTLFCFRYYAPLFEQPSVKVLIIFSYLTYLAIAVWGCTRTKVGLEYAKLLPEGSPTHKYLHNVGEYFTEFSAPLEVLISNRLDYSNSLVQANILDLVTRLENTPYTTDADFWLLDFLQYIATNRLHVSTRDEFEQTLFTDFLNQPQFARYQSQLQWKKPFEMGATRFFVGVRDVRFGHEYKFMRAIEPHLKHSLLNVTAYHRSFQLAEQQNAIIPHTIQNVGIATAIMFVVSIVVIMRPACSICIGLCILSINVGVIGFMSLWSIHLDIVTMITILMSIGISVDYVAHISYFYVTTDEDSQHVPRVQRALQHLGQPILQGAISTVAGMLILLTVRAYMILAFVKTVFLVVAFGLYHGLVLMPVLLDVIIKEENRRPKIMERQPVTPRIRPTVPPKPQRFSIGDTNHAPPPMNPLGSNLGIQVTPQFLNVMPNASHQTSSTDCTTDETTPPVSVSETRTLRYVKKRREQILRNSTRSVRSRASQPVLSIPNSSVNVQQSIQQFQRHSIGAVHYSQQLLDASQLRASQRHSLKLGISEDAYQNAHGICSMNTINSQSIENTTTPNSTRRFDSIARRHWKTSEQYAKHLADSNRRQQILHWIEKSSNEHEQ